MNNLTQETKLTLFYIFIAFTFSVLMRMIWIYQFDDYEAFKYAGEFMINTNDGYYWAEGARDILSGVSQDNDLSPVDSATAKLTAFFVTVLPFSFETTILYMPVYLSSLIVIPIVLIAKSLKNLEMGLIAALLSSIAWSYYNRTMVGYYDTDMLNIVLPMFLLWSIIWAIRTNQDRYLLITALDILVYRWWYPQSYSLEFSFFGLILFYTLIFDRKNLYNYKLMAIMMFAMFNVDGLIRFPLVIAVFYIFKQERYQNYIYHILVVSILLFLTSGGFNPILSKLKGYIFKDEISISKDGLNLHFFTVMQTIREAGEIPFETFANRISGSIVTFVISIFGYIYLLYRHPVMIFSLPMVGLGFLASVGGLRFTIYAVPILAFGIAFMITELTRFVTDKKSVKLISYTVLTLAILSPNYKHILEYRVPTVLNTNEVSVLDSLKSIAQREDYVVSWWDYGYPIRYYADVKTLADGGKHSGSINFPLSFILTSKQDIAAKMARLDVEYTELSFKMKEENTISNIEKMTKDYGYKDTNSFLSSLSSEIELPTKTRDIYFYLPLKMLDIYPTIKLFSNFDLMSGKKFSHPFFYLSRDFIDGEKRVRLGDKIYLYKDMSTLEINKTKLPIKKFVTLSYDSNMKLLKDVEIIDPKAELSVIYLTYYGVFLIVDEQTYNTLYIQLMILEEYDKKLFEQVVSNPHAKIYKLKI
jgi:dolichyl-diphosphooligosaccharide--protein glycosyltransferase/undecaprenyl-diphosphooligosaccharide--protein glycosyltransferase